MPIHRSVASIKSPEFINLQPLEINPLMSSCEIKVLYVGQNRNGSYISKDVASNMAKTLRGAPIVGYYKQDAADFGDHGEQLVIDGDGIHFNCLTMPYGFVAPNANVWFQEFEDTDDFGNVVNREYLMTTGFLWTGQFEEAKRVIEKGNNQSMELDGDSLNGHWSTDTSSNIDFFIIDDATFSKLCLLGEDVEPCFEGATVTAPRLSASFSNNEGDFRATLFSMMKDLKFALERSSDTMGKEQETEFVSVMQMSTEDTTIDEGTVTTTAAIFEEPEAEFKKNDEEEDKEPENKESDSSDDAENKADDKKEEDDNEKKGKKFEKEESETVEEPVNYQKAFIELSRAFEQLSGQCEKYVAELEQLRAFKNTIENAQKDELIEKFYMLSDEDKADVIQNKEKYSLEDIESKLAVICFRKKVNFNLGTIDKNEENIEDDAEDMTVYNLTEDECAVPAWVRAVLAHQNQ